MENDVQKPVIKRIGGYLYRLVPISDGTGKIISHALSPLMVEFRLRDLTQVVVGAAVLSVPVAFTEETWKLGEELPLTNVLALAGISLLFIALYVYFNYYRYQLGGNVPECLKRVFATYICSFIVVAIILTIIQKCPWGADNILAVKRIIIVTFPASMSAAISDTIK